MSISFNVSVAAALPPALPAEPAGVQNLPPGIAAEPLPQCGMYTRKLKDGNCVVI